MFLLTRFLLFLDSTIGINTMDKNVAEYTIEDSRLECHLFCDEILETKLIFQILKLKNSVFIYIGSFSDANFVDLSMAVITPYDKLPLTTKLFGEGSDLTSANLSMKLSKKLNKLVYVSFNLSVNNILLPAIEKRINEEINNSIEKFK